METLTLRVSPEGPVSLSRSELVVFGLSEHPDAGGVMFGLDGAQGGGVVLVCRACVDLAAWLALDGLEVDERALVLFSDPPRCAVCRPEPEPEP